MTQRQRVVARALAWVGTPYHAHARVIGPSGGVDCVHLLCAVYHEAGLVPPIDPGKYPISWHMHQREERYMAALDRRANRTDHPRPGDIALFRFGRCFSHAAIVVADNQLVHAFNRRGGGSVMFAALNVEPLAKRPVIFYDMDSIQAE